MPTEEEEVYPYRRIWRSLALETLILLLVAVGLWVLISFVGVAIPRVLERPAEIALCILPFGLWALLSFLQERTVPEPRTNLLAVVAISALAANAIAMPVIDSVLQVDRWLPMAPALNRIAGYTFTVGIIQVLTCYTVFRLVAYSTGMRIRADGIAYMLAASVGYGCVLNLHYVFTTDASIDIVAMRIFNNISLLYAISVVVGYGLGEVRFGRPSPLLLTLTMAIGAMLAGLAIPLRSGLINAALTLGPAFASPIRGLALSAILLVVVSIVTAFLMENAERRQREAQDSRD
jgi:hypothetical protein